MTDKYSDINIDELPVVTVDTHRSGKFVFQVGADMESIKHLALRVEDAQERFASVPTLPAIVSQIHEEVIVSSIHGTNTIEGGTLTEKETEKVLQGGEDTKEEKQRRVLNLKNAYDLVTDFSENFYEQGYSEIKIREFMGLDLHKRITKGLTDEPRNTPGFYRNNAKGIPTKIGDMKHGGVYTPPKCLDDINMLITAFLSWINSDEILSLPPIIRAPLVHYYFERIHPFWDGNGRVGRVLEALVLKTSGFKYAHFAMSKYYLDEIDEYFSVFNKARMAEEEKEPFPNTVFINFFLNGLLIVINRLHDRVNNLIAYVLYENKLGDHLRSKEINTRQFTIINNLFAHGYRHPLKEVQSKSWYNGLYENLTERTKYRDIKKLEKLELIVIEPDKNVRLLVEA